MVTPTWQGVVETHETSSGYGHVYGNKCNSNAEIFILCTRSQIFHHVSKLIVNTAVYGCNNEAITKARLAQCDIITKYTTEKQILCNSPHIWDKTCLNTSDAILTIYTYWYNFRCLFDNFSYSKLSMCRQQDSLDLESLGMVYLQTINYITSAILRNF